MKKWINQISICLVCCLSACAHGEEIWLRRLDQKESDIGLVIRMDLVVYRPVAGPPSYVSDAALAKSLHAERAINGKTVVFDEYLKALAIARAPLLRSRAYLRDFFIVPIAVGGLDSIYRLADVVVQFHKKYVVFLMRDIIAGEAAPQSSTDLDIYDADDPEVKAALRILK